jgi:hypothetical protein
MSVYGSFVHQSHALQEHPAGQAPGKIDHAFKKKKRRKRAAYKTNLGAGRQTFV